MTEEKQEAPSENTPAAVNEPTDMEKIQSMINEQLQPLRDELNKKEKEITDLKANNQKKDDEINNYRKNMVANAITEKPVDPVNAFVDEYAKNIESGLNAAWRNSGYSKREDLKEQWFKTAWEHIINKYTHR